MTPISNVWYDRLKWTSQIVLPAIATLYAGLAIFWSLPKGVEVTGTITLVASCLGTILGISNVKYNKASEPIEH